MKTPHDIQLIGREIAIAWSDGTESYYPVEKLRAASPSAEQQGERDLFGRQIGGSDQTNFPGVEVTGWERVGNYAIRFDFSDGHHSGLYSFEYLAELGTRFAS